MTPLSLNIKNSAKYCLKLRKETFTNKLNNTKHFQTKILSVRKITKNQTRGTRLRNGCKLVINENLVV